MLANQRFRAVIYSTRGLWLLITQGALLYLKHSSAVKEALSLYLAGFGEEPSAKMTLLFYLSPRPVEKGAK